jgi:hypothetical protein
VERCPLLDESLSAVDAVRLPVLSFLGVAHLGAALDRDAAVHDLATLKAESEG